MYSYYSIPECYNLFSGVKLSVRSFCFIHENKIVRDKIFDFERRAWDSFGKSHPDMRVAHSCLENVPRFRFWSLANQFPDLVSRLHFQVRLMSNFGLNGGIPSLQNTDGAIGKEDIESVTHFFLGCSYFRQNFDSLWNKLELKIAQSNQTDGIYICDFITNLDGHNKALLLSGGGGGGGGLLFRSIMKQTSRLTDAYRQLLARSISSVKKGYLNWRHHS